MHPRKLFIWENNHIKDCLSKNFFQDKTILEIGGCTPKEITEELNVRKWTCIDPAKGIISSISKNYEVIKDSINTHEFEEESFDFAIATNSFEHILNLETALQKIYKALKKGGTLSTLLGPIWSCHKGHHIWIKQNDKLLTFNDKPMDNWAHLLYSEKELSEQLKNHYDAETLRLILFQTYRTDFLNRLFFDDYKNLFLNSKFEIKEMRDWHKPLEPNKSTLKKLQEKYSKENFSTVSIKALLQK